MTSRPILPYYHPTTVIIVDDNDLFLHTLDLRMPAEMAYVLCHDPRKALLRVNQRTSLAPIPVRCMAIAADAQNSHDSTIRLELGLIEEEIKNTERFSRPSVVVVDFAMPEMNGLEFCRSIEDPAVKKILMTGVADERLAVKAFNEGLIDRFLPKHGGGALDLVVAHAQELQKSYFIDQQRAFAETLSLTPPNFLTDQVLSGVFDALYVRHHFVEHYLVADPPGLLMLSATGSLYRWIVLSECDALEQVEFARRLAAPQHVIDALAEQRCVAYLFDDLDALRDDPADWSDYLHRATVVNGSADRWITALVPNPPIDIDFDPEQSSLQFYLDRADHAVMS
jgi:CheY-like chemotaxis protein